MNPNPFESLKNETIPRRGASSGNFSFFGNPELNVFRIDFLALSRIWWSICDIAKLIDISNHAVVVQA